MAQTTSRKPNGSKLYLRCPQCGGADLATIERLTATCQGHATLTIEADGELRPEFHPGGWTDVNWDSSTTVGLECRSCQWRHEGDDHLNQLTAEITEDH
jgi:hypothetical protein